MVFFLPLRESATKPGTIEPDIPSFPSSTYAPSASANRNSSAASVNTMNSRVGMLGGGAAGGGSGGTGERAGWKDSARRWTSGFGNWLGNWKGENEWGEGGEGVMARKGACVAALFLHLPSNVITLFSYGANLGLIVGILLSMLNLFCLAIAFWRLDEMRGARLVYGKIWTRKTFDYIIMGLLAIYALSFIIFTVARFRVTTWRLFFDIVWPVLIATDIFCFVAGWIVTWRDVSGAPLG